MLMRFSGLVFGFSSLSSPLVSLRFSVAGGCCAPCCVVPLWSLRRSAPLVLFGGCEGRPSCLSPRTSCLGAPSAPPDRGSPWEPSRDCLPDEIALTSGSLMVRALAAALPESILFSAL